MALLQSSTSTRENFLEKRILILDKRLTLVEKFIELRFRGGRIGEKDPFSDLSDTEAEDYNKQPSLKISTRHREPQEVTPKRCTVNNNQEQSKPGLASVKMRKEEEKTTAVKKKNLLPEMKNCAVRVTKIDFQVTRESPLQPVATSSGRARRIPKRFEEEDFEECSAKRSKRQSTRGKPSRGEGKPPKPSDYNGKEVNSFVKVERSDTPVFTISDVEVEDAGEDLGQGVCSPLMTGENHQEKEDGEEYFTFVSGPSVSEKRTKNESEASDSDWDGESASDDDVDLRPKKRRGRPLGSSVTGKKRGKYNKVIKVKGELAPKKTRKFVTVPLAEVPAEMIASADPTLKMCDLCKRHIKVDLFEAHLESHARERHLKCVQCDKAYYNTYMLKKHMRVHEPEKYGKKCRQCEGKLFIHADKLLAHERYCVKKTLEKNEYVDPNLIEDLKKRSSDSSWIDEAMSARQEDTDNRSTISTPGDRKVCPHCNKKFKVDFYEKHVKAHLKVKSWSCNLCDKSYHYKHDLVRHVTVEHVTHAKCEFCDQTFKDRTALKKHLALCRRDHKLKGLKIKKVTSLVPQMKNERDGDQQHQGDVDGENDNCRNDLINGDAAVVAVVEEEISIFADEDVECGTPTTIQEISLGELTD